MNKRSAVVLCTTALCTLLSSAGGQSLTLPIVQIIDGDTIKTNITQLPPPLNKVSIRIQSIDAPEKGGRAKCEKERELAEKAINFIKQRVPASKRMDIKNYKWDKYGGRIVADVYFDDQNLGDLLLKAGLAIPYKNRKQGWCQEHD